MQEFYQLQLQESENELESKAEELFKTKQDLERSERKAKSTLFECERMKNQLVEVEGELTVLREREMELIKEWQNELKKEKSKNEKGKKEIEEKMREIEEKIGQEKKELHEKYE